MPYALGWNFIIISSAIVSSWLDSSTNIFIKHNTFEDFPQSQHLLQMTHLHTVLLSVPVQAHDDYLLLIAPSTQVLNHQPDLDSWSTKQPQ